MIAVDASLALKLVLDEPGSTAAREQWQRWTDSREVLIAPVLFCAETFSGLRRSVYSGRLSQEDGDRAYTSSTTLLSNCASLISSIALRGSSRSVSSDQLSMIAAIWR